MTLDETAAQALGEVGEVLKKALPRQVEAMAGPIRKARRIALYGVGREGLMMRSLAMRLFHLGLDAHVVGDMTTPPVGPGDLLIVSAGPGQFSTVSALMGVAKEAGAATMCVTAEPGGGAGVNGLRPEWRTTGTVAHRCCPWARSTRRPSSSSSKC